MPSSQRRAADLTPLRQLHNEWTLKEKVQPTISSKNLCCIPQRCNMRILIPTLCLAAEAYCFVRLCLVLWYFFLCVEFMCKQDWENCLCSSLKEGGTSFFYYWTNCFLKWETASLPCLASLGVGREEQRKERWGQCLWTNQWLNFGWIAFSYPSYNIFYTDSHLLDFLNMNDCYSKASLSIYIPL